MRTNLNNTDSTLLRYDKDIERERQELSKIEEANVKLKADIDVNTQTAERLLSEMAAIEEEKKSNREKLDSLKGAFN
jgi:chromosome segregation ATPase